MDPAWTHRKIALSRFQQQKPRPDTPASTHENLFSLADSLARLYRNQYMEVNIIATSGLSYFRPNSVQAVRLFYQEHNEQGAARLLMELVANPLVPRYTRTYSWQLLSLCTQDFDLAERYLTEARDLCIEMRQISRNNEVDACAQTTDRMMIELNQEREVKRRIIELQRRLGVAPVSLTEQQGEPSDVVAPRLTIVPSRSNIMVDCKHDKTGSESMTDQNEGTTLTEHRGEPTLTASSAASSPQLPAIRIERAISPPESIRSNMQAASTIGTTIPSSPSFGQASLRDHTSATIAGTDV